MTVISPTPPSTAGRGREVRLVAASDWTITVDAADAELLWLDEFLCPPFRSRPVELARRQARVELVVDRQRFEAFCNLDGWPAAARMPVFALDAGAIEMPIVVGVEGERLARDENFRVIYRIAPDLARVELVAAASHLRLRTPLHRVVRELLMGEIFTAGWPLLHASAIEVDGRAIAFVGSTGAGKTSLLLHALGIPGARLLANDRLCVRSDHGASTAFGVPSIVTVRQDSLQFFPAVAARFTASRFGHRRTLAECAAVEAPAPRAWSNGKYGMTPEQLSALLDVERAESGALAAIVLPRRSGERGGLELRRLAPDAARRALHREQLGYGAWMRPAAIIRPPGVADADALAARDAQIERLAEIPVYDSALGLDAYVDPRSRDRLAALLESVP